MLSSSRASTRYISEVDDDVAKARKILKTVEDTCLASILQAQRNVVSVLLQVLYFLHQGNVQFLMGDYRARVLDAHGLDAFPKVPRPGAMAVVHARDIRPPAPNNEQVEVDMIQEDDDESTDTKDSGSSPHHTSGGEEDQTNTPVPSAQQMKATRSQVGTSTPLETTDAKKRTTMTSWAEPDLIRSSLYTERLGFSEPPERRGWDTWFSSTLLVTLAQPLFLIFTFAAAPPAAFPFGVFSFAAFASGVCFSASGLDVLIQVVESGEKVRGEVVEVAGEDIWVLFFPRGDNRVKLRPALDRLAGSFDFRDVGTGLYEARERIIVIDVLCDVIGEIFEIPHRA